MASVWWLGEKPYGSGVADLKVGCNGGCGFSG